MVVEFYKAMSRILCCWETTHFPIYSTMGGNDAKGIIIAKEEKKDERRRILGTFVSRIFVYYNAN
jgi:hypothetical protein